MLQTCATMVSLLLSAGAGGVIALSIWEDRDALRRALAGEGQGALPPLPPRTARVAGPRRARFLTIAAPVNSVRAA